MSARRPHDPPAIGQGTEVITDASGEEWSPPEEGLPVALPVGPERYRIERELARGSMGVIKVARDLSLERLVALKELSPAGAVPNAAVRFLDEARITAQLQHPGIVAVYEIGVGADERPFFTMQLVRGRSLREILDGLLRQEPEMVRGYGRPRLLRIFLQVCNAVAYAHDRGVIHRDLKPDNIMLGDYGEVFVMDWGLAKIIDANLPDPVVGGRGDEVGFSTRVGDITGTPAYMSPEQAMGLVDALGNRTDIYSLGAILYELLIGRPAFTGDSVNEVLRAVRRGQVPAPGAVAPEAEVSPLFDAIVLRCMARDPEDRFAHVSTLRDEVEAAMAGSHTVVRRVQGAARALREAQRAGQVFRELARQRRRAARELEDERALGLPFDPPEATAARWARERALIELDSEQWRAFENALALFDQALQTDPDHQGVHDGLRDLFWYRFLEAERAGDAPAMRLYHGLAARHDRRGVLREARRGDGTLTLQTRPPGASVTLRSVTSDGLRLILGEPRTLGSTPITNVTLPLGAHVAEFSVPGRALVRTSLWVARQECVELDLLIPSPEQTPPGMVYIPAGPFWRGARNPELGAAAWSRATLPGFFIALSPVTIDEYRVFLDDVSARGGGARLARLVPGDGRWIKGSDARHHPTEPALNPVTGVDHRAALAYCAWRAERDGLPWRLPSELEWEKAARGGDGRSYPWGDVWEPTFCRCADSPEGGAPSAIGNAHDQSPYGVLDLAGGVREWTDTEHPRDVRRRALKGGGFASPRAECHLAARAFVKVDTVRPDVGFRLALSAPTL